MKLSLQSFKDSFYYTNAAVNRIPELKSYLQGDRQDQSLLAVKVFTNKDYYSSVSAFIVWLSIGSVYCSASWEKALGRALLPVCLSSVRPTLAHNSWTESRRKFKFGTLIKLTITYLLTLVPMTSVTSYAIFRLRDKTLRSPNQVWQTTRLRQRMCRNCWTNSPFDLQTLQKYWWPKYWPPAKCHCRQLHTNRSNVSTPKLTNYKSPGKCTLLYSYTRWLRIEISCCCCRD